MSSESKPKPYKYFDTPAGEDTFKKLWCLTKPTALWSGGLAIVDVMLLSHPKGYLPTIGRMSYIAAPFLGSSAVFVCAQNTLANIRKKDDKLNWFVSGFLAGTVFGMWRRSTLVGFHVGMFLGIVAFLKKDAVDHNFSLFPMNVNRPSMSCWDYDWTLTKDRPKGYLTSSK